MALDSNIGNITVTSSTPAWLSGRPLNQWFQLSNTILVNSMVGYPVPPGVEGVRGIFSYGTGILKKANSEYFAFGGGHLAYAGNEVLSIRLSDDVPAWTLRRAPTPTAQITFDGERNADGRPNTRHTLSNLKYLEGRNRMVCFGGWAVYGNGGTSTNLVEMFNPSTNDWDHIAGTDYPSIPSGIGGINQPIYMEFDASENCWVFNQFSGTAYRWNNAANTWTALPGPAAMPSYGGMAVFDSSRNRIAFFGDSNNFWIDVATYASTGTRNTFPSIGSQSLGAVYVSDLDAYLIMRAGNTTILRVNPTTFAQSSYSIGGLTIPSPGSGPVVDGYIGSRFFYSPTLKCIGYVHNAETNIYMCRIGVQDSYSTTFPLTENPISEGGLWTTGGTHGLLWSNPRTTGGNVIGTHAGIDYDDSLAHLNGFAANHFIEGTIYRTGTFSTNQEVELHVRHQITANNARGYECLWNKDGNFQIFRWGGPFNSFIEASSHTITGMGVPQNGDRFKASVVGTTISIYKNDVLMGTCSIASSNFSGAAAFTDGNPGMGFFTRDTSGDQNTRFGFSSITAGSL